MYQIVSIDMGDDTVSQAVNAILGGQTMVPAPGGAAELITETDDTQQGTGPSGNVLVVVGHGSPAGVSGLRTWNLYTAKLSSQPAADPSAVYVVACSTADAGSTFAYGNFANSVKSAFPNATVWASKTPVQVPSLAGQWTIV